VGRAIVPSKAEGKFQLRVGRAQAGRADMVPGGGFAARRGMTVLVAEMKTGLVFVADRRGRRGEKANEDSDRAEPNGNY
jgi:hypothetical protein